MKLRSLKPLPDAFLSKTATEVLCFEHCSSLLIQLFIPLLLVAKDIAEQSI